MFCHYWQVKSGISHFEKISDMGWSNATQPLVIPTLCVRLKDIILDITYAFVWEGVIFIRHFLGVVGHCFAKSNPCTNGISITRDLLKRQTFNRTQYIRPTESEWGESRNLYFNKPSRDLHPHLTLRSSVKGHDHLTT